MNLEDQKIINLENEVFAKLGEALDLMKNAQACGYSRLMKMECPMSFLKISKQFRLNDSKKYAIL